MPGKINCYAEDFFHNFSGDKPEELRVHYLADSNHQWKYGHPLHIDYYDLPQKMQLLTHPYSWSEEGYDNVNIVVGQDRLSEFENLAQKYNGDLYDFEEIKVISAGPRDSEKEGAEGMSASKLR